MVGITSVWLFGTEVLALLVCFCCFFIKKCCKFESWWNLFYLGSCFWEWTANCPGEKKSQEKVSQDNDLVEMGTYSTVFASLEQNVSLHSCFETGYLLFSLYILLGLGLSACSELLHAFIFTFLKIFHWHAFIGCLPWWSVTGFGHCYGGGVKAMVMKKANLVHAQIDHSAGN